MRELAPVGVGGDGLRTRVRTESPTRQLDRSRPTYHECQSIRWRRCDRALRSAAPVGVGDHTHPSSPTPKREQAPALQTYSTFWVCSRSFSTSARAARVRLVTSRSALLEAMVLISRWISWIRKSIALPTDPGVRSNSPRRARWLFRR